MKPNKSKLIRRKLKERLIEFSIEAFLFLCGFVSIFTTASVLYILLTKTYDFFSYVPFSAFFLGIESVFMKSRTNDLRT